MSFQLLVQDQVVYQGDPIPIPRVGDAFQGETDAMPVEAVTWDFRSTDRVTVTLILGSRPYTY